MEGSPRLSEANEGRLTVLAVSVTAQIGGAERSLLELLRCFDRRKLDIRCACPVDGPLVDELVALGVQFYPVPFQIGASTDPRGLYSLVSCGWRLLHSIQASGAGLVYANNGAAAVYAALPAMAARTPLVSHLRDLHTFSRAGKALLNSSRSIVVNSAATQRCASEMGLHPKTTVVYNGVDLEKFKPHCGPNALKQELGLPEDALIVGLAGVIAPNKRLEDFLTCASQTRALYPAARFVVVGDVISPAHQAYKDEIKALANARGLGRDLYFLGFRKDVATVLQSLDVLVHTRENEGFCRVAVEAMACGIPVAAKRAGGPIEIVQEGVTGFLAPPGDLTTLSQQIAVLLGDEALRRQFGAAGRRRAEELFDARLYTRRLEEVFAAAAMHR